MKFSILVPTRERPEIFARMIQSAKYSQGTDCEVLVFFDTDDVSKDSYDLTLADDAIMEDVKSVGFAWNRLAEDAQGEFLMMANDDIVFEQDWDMKLLPLIAERLPADGFSVFWCADGTGRKACTFPFVSRKWYEALGYLAPTCFNFLWHDTWVGDIAQRANRGLFIPEVLIEHRHFSLKDTDGRAKAGYDETYRRNREGTGRSFATEDRRRFATTAKERAVDAQTIRRAIERYGSE
jgi:hypothetical protein